MSSPLLTIQDVLAGASLPAPALEELVVTVFAILDGYDLVGDADERLRLMCFFACFARRHPPAAEAFVAAATYEYNIDRAIAGATFAAWFTGGQLGADSVRRIFADPGTDGYSAIMGLAWAAHGGFPVDEALITALTSGPHHQYAFRNSALNALRAKDPRLPDPPYPPPDVFRDVTVAKPAWVARWKALAPWGTAAYRRHDVDHPLLKRQRVAAFREHLRSAR